MNGNNSIIRLVTPDWSITWDTKQIAEEFPGFQFQGPGWYSKDNTWMLVIPTTTQDVYSIQVFFDRDPRPGFLALAGLLVRQQEEPEPETVEDKSIPGFGGIVVLLIGIMILLPTFGWLYTKLHAWSVPIMFAVAFVWARLIRWVNQPKKEAEKKT